MDVEIALDRILPHVEKPARYTGGEYNSIVKNWTQVPYRLALAFPDTYELGMSNLGLAILYDIVNKEPDMLAERVYCPWPDMEGAMRREGIPLYSLETYHPLTDFDVIGFSLPYEQLYTNVLTMLDLAGLPLRAAERDEHHPLIIAGGSAVYNPEPMADFFDAFIVGEGEEVILEVMRTYGGWREDWDQALTPLPPSLLYSSRGAGLCGPPTAKFGRGSEGHPAKHDLLRRLARIEGVYVPSFYEAEYNADGTFAAIHPTVPDVPARITKRIVPVLPPPVTRFIVPYLDIVHNRAAIEIQRGCTRGCRFCHAGMVFRPVRERPLAEILQAVDDIIAQTGFEEVSFLSLSSSDYSKIGDLVRETMRRHGDKRLSIGLPSLRIESFSVDIMEQLEKGRRRSGFTFAPEAATDRLRDVINKPVSTDALLQVAEEVYSRGWTTIKLYFMIGHPTQTMEDVRAIARLARQVLAVGRKHIGKKANVRIGVSTLVPKPHTPFQWVPLEEESLIREQLSYLRDALSGPGLHLNWNNPRETLLEAVLSRGDRRLGRVIRRAWELGAKLDGWQDQFNDAAWTQAYQECGIDPDFYARRPRALDEAFPWDHIDVGLKKKFLADEYQNALAGKVIVDCREHCFSCGILKTFKEERKQTPDEMWGCPAVGHRRTGAPLRILESPVPVDESLLIPLSLALTPQPLSPKVGRGG
ncbi:MAG: TIGR03960 family B12-binding radical SAM protein [Anaerolineae bacterium]|nr:TIGR03960 family B12-binding radical SAM protein [Anaerolineae bacterium]